MSKRSQHPPKVRVPMYLGTCRWRVPNTWFPINAGRQLTTTLPNKAAAAATSKHLLLHNAAFPRLAIVAIVYFEGGRGQAAPMNAMLAAPT